MSRPSPLEINLEAPVFQTDERFLSVTIDTAHWVGAEWKWGKDKAVTGEAVTNRGPLNLRSPLLQNLARELGPAFLRVGGSTADDLYYDFDEEPERSVPYGYKCTATKEDWDSLSDFISATGMKLVLTLNAGPSSRDSHGSWQTNQARIVLEQAHGTGLCPAVIELGNEVNAYGILRGPKSRVSAGRYACDYATLKGLAGAEIPGTRVAGPASAYWPKLGEVPTFPSLLTGIMLGFLKHSRVPVDVITWHYYPTQSRHCPLRLRKASLRLALNPSTLDNINHQVKGITRAHDKYQPQAEMWLGETGPAQCGGEPGLSDRFASSFWWVDALGSMARHRQKVVARQSLVGSDYGLLEEESFSPRPDYWASWLWKRWMGTLVFKVELDGTSSRTKDGYLRAYAHSLRGTSGGVAVMIMNLSWDRTRFVELPPELRGLARQQYVVSAPNDDPLSTTVQVNGRELRLGPRGQMPSLEAITSVGAESTVMIPPLSYQFILFPDAHAPASGKSK